MKKEATPLAESKPKNMKLYYLDKNGWPLERIKGRYLQNALRILLHCKTVTSIRPKCLDPQINSSMSGKTPSPLS